MTTSRTALARRRARNAIAYGTTTAFGTLALAASAGAADPTGGASASPPPSIASVQCRLGCAGIAAAQAGSTIELRGANLAGVVRVTFVGRRGRADDRATEPLSAAAGTVTVRVPAGARSGPLRVLTSDAQRSPRSAAVLTLSRTGARTQAPLRAGNGAPVDARVVDRRIFFDGTKHARLDYVLGGHRATDIAIDLVRAQDGSTVAHWDEPQVAPGAVRTIEWDGLANGVAQPEGRYSFRITAGGAPLARRAQAPGGAGAPATPIDANDPTSFVYLGHIFPIRGPHTYGDGGGRFGAGRAGHSHQGQDVFASCGTPLAAARGGRVKARAFQGNAGNYIVIDGAQTGDDYAYMHLRDPALAKVGQRVHTGELIGFVGDTGDAVGCHLHFELWSAPGWYSGGSPRDPLAELQGWDKTS